MKLIKLSSDYYVIVDDSRIKEGDWMFLEQGNTPATKQGGIAQCKFPNADDDYEWIVWKKITHSTKHDKGMDNVTFISLSEVNELLREVDVEKKSWEYTFKKFGEVDDFYDTQQGFIDGYNQALEDNKDKIKNILMEYDLMVKKHLLMYSIEHSIHGKICEGLSVVRNEYIQSLQPPTSWDVEFVNGKLKLI